MSSKERKTSIVMQENIVTVGANRIKTSPDYSKVEDPLYVDQRHEPRQTLGQWHVGQLQPVMNHNEPLKEHGVLNWDLLENWKSNEKRVPSRFNIKTSPRTDNTTLVESRSVRLPRCKKQNQQSPRSFEFDSPYPFSDVPHSCPFPLPRSAEVDRPNLTRVTPLRGRSLEENNWKKSNATNPSRYTSPLKRFLDPFLKLKGAHVADKVHKSKLDLIPTGITPMNEYEIHQNKKLRSSNFQAILRLTLKNGIPFFKLESSSDILVAVVKNLPSGKDDTSLVYTFYSVRETKKKSGSWIHQNSKENSHHFEYNPIGEMKICSSYHVGLYMVRESVLYSMSADEKTVDLKGEQAAIIVKNQSDETCGDIGNSRTMTVVLPDSVHTWPDSGLSSPLINRWRYGGGSCDCGGWDGGCQFRFLKNSKTLSSPNHLDLSYQAGQKNKCSFRLVSVEDGVYSVEYDPSISLLQAFAICVAVVSSQRLAQILV